MKYFLLLLISFTLIKTSKTQSTQSIANLDTSIIAGKLAKGLQEIDSSRYILAQHYFLKALKQSFEEENQFAISSSYSFLAFVNHKNGNLDSALVNIDRALSICTDSICEQYGYLDKLEILCSNKNLDTNKVLAVLNRIDADFAVAKNSARPMTLAYLKLNKINEARSFLDLMKSQVFNYHDSLNYYDHFLNLYSQDYNKDSILYLNSFIESIPITTDLFDEKIKLINRFLKHPKLVKNKEKIKDKLLDLRKLEKVALDKQIADAVLQAKQVNELISKEESLQREKSNLQRNMSALFAVIVILLALLLVITRLNRKVNRAKETIQEEKDLNQFLLHENNHRIKNNLQIILSIISLSKYSDEDPEKIFTDIESRLRAISTLQDYINNNNAVIKKQAFNDIINDLLNQVPKSVGINLNLDFKDDIKFSNEFLSSFAIMLNEMITNSIKHTFGPQKSQQLKLDITISPDYLLFDYNDYAMITSESNRNLGLDIIEASISKHNGVREETKDNIYQYKVKFPKNEVLA